MWLTTPPSSRKDLSYCFPVLLLAFWGVVYGLYRSLYPSLMSIPSTSHNGGPSNLLDGGPNPSSPADQQLGSHYTPEQLVKLFGGWTAARIRRKLRGPIVVALSQEAEWPWYAVIGLLLTEFLNTLVELGPVGALCFSQARVHEPEVGANAQSSPDNNEAPNAPAGSTVPVDDTQAPSVAKPRASKKTPKYQVPDFAHLACYPEADSPRTPFMRLINWLEVKRVLLGTGPEDDVEGVYATKELVDDMPQLEKQARQAFLRESGLDGYIMIYMRGLDFTALEWTREALGKLTMALDRKKSALEEAASDEPRVTAEPEYPSIEVPSITPAMPITSTSEPQRRTIISYDLNEKADTLNTLQFQGTWFWKPKHDKKLLGVAGDQLTAYRNIVTSKHQPHIPDESFDPLLKEFDDLTPQDLVDMHPTMIYHAQNALIGDGENVRASDSFVNTLRLAHRLLAPHAEYSYSEFFPLPKSLDACEPSTAAMNKGLRCMAQIYKHTIERLWEERFELVRTTPSEANTSVEWPAERRYDSDEQSDDDEEDEADYEDQPSTKDTATVLLQNRATSSLPTKQARGARAVSSGSSRIPIATGRHAEPSTSLAPRRGGLRPRTDAGKAIIPIKGTSSAALSRGVSGAAVLAASTQGLSSASVARASSSSSMVVSAMGRMTVSGEAQSSKAGPSRLPKPTNANGEATGRHDRVGPREHTETSSAAKKGKGKEKAVQESIPGADSTRTRNKGKKRVASDDESSALEARTKKAKRNGEGDSE
ncbi:hypothetical protein PENSPDRAFT_747200 [Peniophora sp. CONT]|nr:hypothetical protein PENSPDRAFT_747200 [Peniophora sp. CONT]